MIWTLLNDQAPYLISKAEPRNILKKAHSHQSEAVHSWKKGRVPSAGWGWASAPTGRILIIDKWRILCCFLRVFFYIWVCWCQGNKLTLTSSLSSTVSVAGLCAIGQLFLQETVLKCRIFLSCLTGPVSGSHRGHYRHSILKGKAHEQMCFYPILVHSALQPNCMTEHKAVKLV